MCIVDGKCTFYVEDRHKSISLLIFCFIPSWNMFIEPMENLIKLILVFFLI